jgi:hypothetical protein
METDRQRRKAAEGKAQVSSGASSLLSSSQPPKLFTELWIPIEMDLVASLQLLVQGFSLLL